jgi:hypothetical protein
MNRYSSISTVSRYGLDSRGSIPGRSGDFLPHNAVLASEAPIQWVHANYFSRVKRLELEPDTLISITVAQWIEIMHDA